MRPRVFSLRNILLVLAAAVVFGGLYHWLSRGAPLPAPRIASTAGKIAFVSDRSGNKDIWLMDADGSNAAALTKDDADDSQPAWSPAGNQIAFVSSRKAGAAPQIFLMYAAPGQSARQITITSGSKSDPVFTKDGVLFFIDSGKVVSLDPRTSDADAVFPSSDLRLTLASLLSTGGISPATPSQDEQLIASQIGLEQGKALLLLDRKEIDEHTDDELVLLGVAYNGAVFAFRQDDGLVAIFRGGQPVPQRQVLLNGQVLAENPSFTPPPIPSPMETDSNVLALFQPDGAMNSALPLPFAPTGLAVSPSTESIVFTLDEGDGKAVGVFLLTPGQEQGGIRQLAEEPARQPAFSPDGKMVAFVSGKDIYVVPIDGSSPAKNLTNGSGTNSSPVWSPLPAATASK